MRYLYPVILLFFFTSCIFNCTDYLNDEVKPRRLNGKVISKYKDEVGCFGTLVLQNDKLIDTVSDLCYCGPEIEDVWTYVTVGDSLQKSAGSLKVTIMRGSGKKSFDYPCCAQ
jgi:hypothetical protein